MQKKKKKVLFFPIYLDRRISIFLCVLIIIGVVSQKTVHKQNDINKKL